MISIVICSVNPDHIDSISISIKNTIGLRYEIIAIDNSENKYSITQAYNMGAKRSIFENLIFVHEDVEFISENWGEKLVNILKNKEIGIVGVAGSTYLPSVPSGWYLPDEKYNKVFIHQGFKYKKQLVRFDNQGEDLTPVYLLDGVFLGMRKELWEEFPFYEDLVGFHAYDVNICQRVCTKYQNIFTKQIELLHLSEGKVDKSYFDALLFNKLSFSKSKYIKLNFELEFILLKSLYSNLRCYYDKKTVITKIKPYLSTKNLGYKGFFNFVKYIFLNE